MLYKVQDRVQFSHLNQYTKYITLVNVKVLELVATHW